MFGAGIQLARKKQIFIFNAGRLGLSYENAVGVFAGLTALSLNWAAVISFFI